LNMATKTRPKTGKKTVCVQLDAEAIKGLSRVAKTRSCSIGAVIRVAINQALEVAP